MTYPGLGPVTVRAPRGKGPRTKKKAKALQEKKEQDKLDEFKPRKLFSEDN